MNKIIKLTDSQGKVRKFKPYKIGNIPPNFDKRKHLHFNKNGLTYIEDQPHWSDALK